jgi:Caspase domain
VSQKKALIIGISEYYNLRPLKFCENDGKQMVNLLNTEPLGYETIKLIGKVSWTDMKNAINTFFYLKMSNLKIHFSSIFLGTELWIKMVTTI